MVSFVFNRWLTNRRFAGNEPVVIGALVAVVLVAIGWTSWPVRGADSTEFRRRLASVSGEDIPTQVNLAGWAAAEQLLDEAEQLYRDILARDSDNSAAFQGLWAIAEQRTLERNSDTLESARKALPAKFVEYQSKRFVILSDADPRWTRQQLDILERAHHQFQRFATRLDLRPLPLQHKLVCILFAEREGYQTFAREEDGVSELWISGYYSPRNDWVVFYNADSDPRVAQARQDLSEMQNQLKALARQVKDAELARRPDEVQRLRQTLAQATAHFSEQQRRIDDYAATQSAATTVHEATHQLLFHTGVQARQVRYPLWICEGLATSFETDSPREAFGPDHDYRPRREGFQRSLDTGRLLPLRELLVIDRLANQESESAESMYNESYALVMWMCRFRKAELRHYLMTMRLQPRGETAPARIVELFERSFGDVENLERTWLRAERTAAKSALDASLAGASQQSSSGN